jgi:hypothetical protein
MNSGLLGSRLRKVSLVPLLADSEMVASFSPPGCGRVASGNYTTGSSHQLHKSCSFFNIVRWTSRRVTYKSRLEDPFRHVAPFLQRRTTKGACYTLQALLLLSIVQEIARIFEQYVDVRFSRCIMKKKIRMKENNRQRTK